MRSESVYCCQLESYDSSLLEVPPFCISFSLSSLSDGDRLIEAKISIARFTFSLEITGILRLFALVIPIYFILLLTGADLQHMNLTTKVESSRTVTEERLNFTSKSLCNPGEVSGVVVSVDHRQRRFAKSARYADSSFGILTFRQLPSLGAICKCLWLPDSKHIACSFQTFITPFLLSSSSSLFLPFSAPPFLMMSPELRSGFLIFRLQQKKKAGKFLPRLSRCAG